MLNFSTPPSHFIAAFCPSPIPVQLKRKGRKVSAASGGKFKDQQVDRGCSCGRSFPWSEQWCQHLLCSSPLDAALRLIPPRAGPSPKGDSCAHLYCRLELKDVMEHLPALWLPEIPRKSLPQHIVFSNRNSSVLVAAVYSGRIPWDKAFAFFYDELLFSRG